MLSVNLNQYKNNCGSSVAFGKKNHEKIDKKINSSILSPEKLLLLMALSSPLVPTTAEARVNSSSGRYLPGIFSAASQSSGGHHGHNSKQVINNQYGSDGSYYTNGQVIYVCNNPSSSISSPNVIYQKIVDVVNSNKSFEKAGMYFEDIKEIPDGASITGTINKSKFNMNIKKEDNQVKINGTFQRKYGEKADTIDITASGDTLKAKIGNKEYISEINYDEKTETYYLKLKGNDEKQIMIAIDKNAQAKMASLSKEEINALKDKEFSELFNLKPEIKEDKKMSEKDKQTLIFLGFLFLMGLTLIGGLEITCR